MKKVSVLLAWILLVWLFPGSALAGPWGPPPPMGPRFGPCMGPPYMGHHPMGPGWWMRPYVISSLNLTLEQTTRLQSLREAYLKEIVPLEGQLFARRAELRLLWAEPNPNEEKIFAKLDEILDLQKRLRRRTIRYLLDCRAVLTPQQRNKLAAFPPRFWGLRWH